MLKADRPDKAPSAGLQDRGSPKIGGVERSFASVHDVFQRSRVRRGVWTAHSTYPDLTECMFQ